MQIKRIETFFTIGASHFSLTVDDLEKTYDYLVKNGVKFTAPPQQTPDKFCKSNIL